jgi:hypothetical protein
MNLRKIAFKFHKWPGIVFLIPGLIVSITTILIGLNDTLHLDKVKISAGSGKASPTEIRNVLQTQNAGTFIATKRGLFVKLNNQIKPVKEFSGYDVRGLAVINDSVYIASKQGLWRIVNSNVTQLSKDEVWNVQVLNEEFLLLSAGKKGIVVTDTNGKKLKDVNNPLNLTDLDQIAHITGKEPMTLHKLIMDLHTGEAFTSKALKPVYIVSSGVLFLVITLTGFWLVFGKKKKKKQHIHSKKSGN